MKIQRFEPDQEGYIRPNNIIRPLVFGLYKGKPAFWAVVDPTGNEGINAKVVLKSDGDTIGPELLPNWRVTLVNEKTAEVWHVFEEPSKIIQGGGLHMLGGPMQP